MDSTKKSTFQTPKAQSPLSMQSPRGGYNPLDLNSDSRLDDAAISSSSWKKGEDDDIIKLIKVLGSSQLQDESNNTKMGQPLTLQMKLKLLEIVVTTLSDYSDQHPGRPEKHAKLLRECTYIFAKDTDWQREIAKSKIKARVFGIHKLIKVGSAEIRRACADMASVMLAKVPGLEIEDISDDQLSNDMLQSSLLKNTFTALMSVRDRLNFLKNDHKDLIELNEFSRHQVDEVKASIAKLQETQKVQAVKPAEVATADPSQLSELKAQMPRLQELTNQLNEKMFARDFEAHKKTTDQTEKDLHLLEGDVETLEKRLTQVTERQDNQLEAMERRIKNHMQQNQTSSLDEMVKQLGNSIASLQAQNKTLGEKLAMSVTHANEVDNKIDSIEKSFQSLDNRIEQLKQDSAKKINDLAHAKPAEQEMNRSVDTQKLEQQVTLLKNSVQSIESKLGSIPTEVKQNGDFINEIDKEVRALDRNLQHSDKTSVHVEQLEKEVMAHFEQQTKEFVKRIAELTEHSQQNKRKQENLDEEFEHVDEELLGLHKKIEKLYSGQQTLEGKLAEINGSLQTDNREELLKRLEEIVALTQKLEQQVTSLTNSVQSIESKLGGIPNEVKQNGDFINEIDKEVQALDRDLHAMEQRLGSLNATALTQKLQQFEGLNTMVSELENKLRTMADLMHSMEKQTNQYLQEKVSELLRHVHEIDDNVFQHDNLIHETKRKLVSLQTAHDAFEQKVDSINNKQDEQIMKLNASYQSKLDKTEGGIRNQVESLQELTKKKFATQGAVNELQRKMESVENAFQQHRVLVDKINDEQDSKLDELADKVHLQFQKNQEKMNALHGTVMNTQRKPIEDLPRLNDNDGAVKMMRIELEAQNRANEREVAKLRQALDTLQTNLADSIHHLIDQIAEVKDSALSQYGVARKQDDNTLRLLRVSLEDSIKNNEREFAKMKNDFNVMADSFIKLKQSSIASTQPEAKEVPSAKLRAVVRDDTGTLKAAIKDLQENQDNICDDLDGIEKNIKSMQDTLVDLVLKSKQQGSKSSVADDTSLKFIRVDIDSAIKANSQETGKLKESLEQLRIKLQEIQTTSIQQKMTTEQWDVAKIRIEIDKQKAADAVHDKELSVIKETMSGMKASLAEMMNSGKLATIRSGNPVTVSDDAVKSLRKELKSELAAMNTNMQSMQDAMVDLVMKQRQTTSLQPPKQGVQSSVNAQSDDVTSVMSALKTLKSEVEKQKQTDVEHDNTLRDITTSVAGLRETIAELWKKQKVSGVQAVRSEGLDRPKDENEIRVLRTDLDSLTKKNERELNQIKETVKVLQEMKVNSNSTKQDASVAQTVTDDSAVKMLKIEVEANAKSIQSEIEDIKDSIKRVETIVQTGNQQNKNKIVLSELDRDVRELQIQVKTNQHNIESLTEEISRLDKNIALVGRQPTQPGRSADDSTFLMLKQEMDSNIKMTEQKISKINETVSKLQTMSGVPAQVQAKLGNEQAASQQNQLDSLKREQRETTTKLAEIDKTLSSLMNAIQILQKQKGGATASQVEPVGKDFDELRQKMEETAQSVQQMQYSIDDLKMLMTESSGKSGMGTDGITTKALETRIKSLENQMKSSGVKGKTTDFEEPSDLSVNALITIQKALLKLEEMVSLHHKQLQQMPFSNANSSIVNSILNPTRKTSQVKAVDINRTPGKSMLQIKKKMSLVYQDNETDAGEGGQSLAHDDADEQVSRTKLGQAKSSQSSSLNTKLPEINTGRNINQSTLAKQ